MQGVKVVIGDYVSFAKPDKEKKHNDFVKM